MSQGGRTRQKWYGHLYLIRSDLSSFLLAFSPDSPIPLTPHLKRGEFWAVHPSKTISHFDIALSPAKRPSRPGGREPASQPASRPICGVIAEVRLHRETHAHIKYTRFRLYGLQIYGLFGYLVHFWVVPISLSFSKVCRYKVNSGQFWLYGQLLVGPNNVDYISGTKALISSRVT